MYNSSGIVDIYANNPGGNIVQREKSVSRYRGIDLLLFTVLLAVFETVIVKAATSWFPQEAWMVSAVPAITAIVMVRWGPWCAIHAALGGVITTLALGGGWQQFLIYAIGNLAVMAVLPLERKWGWKKLHEGIPAVLLFSILIVLSMQAGRAALSMILGFTPADAWRMTAMDSITYLFTLLIIWIVSRLDGMLEDQAHYLKRLSHEPEQ